MRLPSLRWTAEDGRSRERFLEELLGAAAIAPVMQDKTKKVQSFAAVGRCFEDLR
jgi:hypothetical protein